MEENCCHLLEMAIDMENDIGLNKRRRNCFQTAFSWLKKRFGNPQNVSAKGLDKIAKWQGE